MTFRELLKKCRYKDVFNIIYPLYYKNKSHSDVYMADMGYRKVFENLLVLDSSPQEDYKIYISLQEEAGAGFVDVSLYSNEDEEIYAIDFTPWETLIDAAIYNTTDLEAEELAAHILWEITFYGYSSASVAEAKSHLEDEIKKPL